MLTSTCGRSTGGFDELLPPEPPAKPIPPATKPPPTNHGTSPPKLEDTGGNKTSKPAISLKLAIPFVKSNHKNAQSSSSNTKSETRPSSYCAKKFSMVITSPFFSLIINVLPSCKNS